MESSPREEPLLLGLQPLRGRSDQPAPRPPRTSTTSCSSREALCQRTGARTSSECVSEYV